MGDIVNLNRYRKQRQRGESGRKDGSHTRAGLTKVERRRREDDRARGETALDGKQLSDPLGPDDTAPGDLDPGDPDPGNLDPAS